MAKNVRKMLGWKPTLKGIVSLGARPIGMTNGLGGVADGPETLVAMATEITTTKDTQAERTMAQAQYFATKSRLTA